MSSFLRSLAPFAFGACGAALIIGSGAVLAQSAPAETTTATAPRPPMRGPMGDMARADANGDGTLTRAEATAAAESAFARMDANRDGRLTEADRTAAGADHSAAMFARLDSNSDGSISRSEWDAGHSAMAGRMAAAGDGEGPGGRHARHGRRGGRGMGGPEAMMRRADANGDQAVDRSEFVAGALRRFDRQDANSDGSVTADERRAGRRGGRGMGGGEGMFPPPPPPAGDAD